MAHSQCLLGDQRDILLHTVWLRASCFMFTFTSSKQNKTKQNKTKKKKNQKVNLSR